MARTPRASLGGLALTLALAAACSATPVTPERVAPTPVAEAQTEEVPADDAKAKDDAKVVTPPPLSEEDLALIAADPKDLTPELRRKRAYARRRQIMQNPDSPAARALNDLAEAHQAGDLDVERTGSGTWLSAPGTKPASGRPPAGWRAPAQDGDAPPAAADPPSQP